MRKGGTLALARVPLLLGCTYMYNLSNIPLATSFCVPVVQAHPSEFSSELARVACQGGIPTATAKEYIGRGKHDHGFCALAPTTGSLSRVEIRSIAKVTPFVYAQERSAIHLRKGQPFVTWDVWFGPRSPRPTLVLPLHRPRKRWLQSGTV